MYWEIGQSLYCENFTIKTSMKEYVISKTVSEVRVTGYGKCLYKESIRIKRVLQEKMFQLETKTYVHKRKGRAVRKAEFDYATCLSN